MDQARKARDLERAFQELEHFEVLLLDDLREHLKVVPDLLFALVDPPIGMLVLGKKRAPILLCLLLQVCEFLSHIVDIFFKGGLHAPDLHSRLLSILLVPIP